MSKKRIAKQKHDDFTKHQLLHKEEVKDLLNGCLPKELLEMIDLNTLHFEDREFAPSRYRGKRHVDILWTVRTKDGERIALFFHIEGQSTHERKMAIRILEYHVAFIKKFDEMNDESEKCPPIITFVLYHGDEEWTSAKSIADLFTNFDVYVTYGLRANFLIDLKKKTVTEILKDGSAGITELILQGDFSKNLELIIKGLRNKKECCVEGAINYISLLKGDDPMALCEEIRKFDQTIANQYSTMFEHIEKRYMRLGKQEGIQLGKQEGIQLGKQEGIQLGKQEGIQLGKQEGIQQVIQILKKRGLSQKEIQEILKETK